jgi:3-methyladenine DNA glycosylase AlkD
MGRTTVSTRPEAHTVATVIERALRQHGDPNRRAVLTGGYAPSRLRTIGVSVPALRRVVRRFAAELAPTSARHVVAVARALVARGTLEGRQAGYELVARRPDAMALLTPALVERLGRGNDNWASVDGFATHLVGPAWRHGRVADRDVCRWAASSDRWWRRTALASTVALNVAARGGLGDPRRTLMVCRRFVGEADPMLAKALSWSLRSLVPHDPVAVRDFLARHGSRLPALVVREVAAKLDTGRKQRTRPQGRKPRG